MPKVTVNYDSDAYTLDVSVNGVPIDNVQRVYFSKGSAWDNEDEIEINCCIETRSTSEDGVEQYTRLMASESVEGAEALKKGATNHPVFEGFVSVPAYSPSRVKSEFGKFAEKFLCL